MKDNKPSVLYLTDFYYQANGRRYFEEDLFITGRLKEHFNLLIGHPRQALSFLRAAPLIVFRNTGPVMWYKDYFDRFVAAVKEQSITTFNSFDGKADQKGKDYLVQLSTEGYPVIPTVDNINELERLAPATRYMVKLKNGADSIGTRCLSKEELLKENLSGQLVQPFLHFRYEVSFYFLNNVFQYALYAPDAQQRWALENYTATAEDLAFAECFIRWNGMAHGIVRVDACRMPDESLLLVELEDLNPFLSLDVLSEKKREQFIGHFVEALKEAVAR